MSLFSVQARARAEDSQGRFLSLRAWRRILSQTVSNWIDHDAATQSAALGILPDVDIPWRDVWFGATATSGLFCLGKWLIGLYLGRPMVTSPYGAAGALVLVTLWVYYASFILLFGAEFTRVFSRTVLGSRRHASAGAKRVRVVQQEIPDNPR